LIAAGRSAATLARMISHRDDRSAPNVNRLLTIIILIPLTKPPTGRR
jgi:hypothetical protein